MSTVDENVSERSFTGRTGLFIFPFFFSLQTYTTCKTKHVSMQKRDTKPVRFPIDLTLRCCSHEEIYLTSRSSQLERRDHICVSVASSSERNGITPILILVQKHLKQAADLRSIDEEKIKTREAHRRQILRYSVYLLYYHFYHIA